MQGYHEANIGSPAVDQIPSYIASTRLGIMYDIASAKKMENGVVVFFQMKGEKKFESFNYEELIDMKINALDLIQYPERYSLDLEVHKVYQKG